MKKIINLIFLIVLLVGSGYAQKNSDVLLTIDTNKITTEEFLRIYKKNNQNLQSGEKASIDDYLDMFINFKLKVLEAEKLGLDTIPSVKNELEKYNNELAKPYFLDSTTLERLTKEAYQRSKKEVRASHILIKFPSPMSYKDTLFAYKKAENIRRRITVKQESFREVAKATSDDPSVKTNGGDVGYFSVFQMLYPFETAVYNMKNGQISNPVRSRLGYHIIKKTGEREAKGKIKVAHIMLIAPKTMTKEEQQQKKEKINAIYHKIMSGADFSEMAKKYSEDKASAVNGGVLPWFGVGRMVPSFEDAAFSLNKVGEISQPVRTSVGWHIIKLLDRKEIGSFKESKKLLKRKIQNSPRYKIAKDSLVLDLKKQYDYQYDTMALSKITNKLIEDNKFYPNRINTLTKNKTLLFSFDDKKYTIGDFANYLENPPKRLTKQYKDKYLFDEAFKNFTENEILKYEKDHLKAKYPEYKYLIKEYHDGILLFEIMDRKVWSKAAEDTVGLKAYFENNRDKYKWGERYQGKIYFCNNQQTLEKVKKMKKGGLFKKSYSDEEILSELNTNEQKSVEIKKGLFIKGENPIIDYNIWHVGAKSKIENKRPYFITGKIVPPQNKTLDEARGVVIADYQNYLEEQWIKELKEKYNIDINEKVLKELKEKFK